MEVNFHLCMCQQMLLLIGTVKEQSNAAKWRTSFCEIRIWVLNSNFGFPSKTKKPKNRFWRDEIVLLGGFQLRNLCLHFWKSKKQNEKQNKTNKKKTIAILFW